MTIARYLRDLHPRACIDCGDPTGSGALDKCEKCDPLFLECGASEYAEHTHPDGEELERNGA